MITCENQPALIVARKLQDSKILQKLGYNAGCYAVDYGCPGALPGGSVIFIDDGTEDSRKIAALIATERPGQVWITNPRPLGLEGLFRDFAGAVDLLEHEGDDLAGVREDVQTLFTPALLVAVEGNVLLPFILSGPAMHAAHFPQPEPILSPWLSKSSIAMVHGPAGSGKTLTLLGACKAICSGGDFLKWQADRPRRVLFVDGEMPAGEMKTRLFKTGLFEEENFHIILATELGKTTGADLNLSEAKVRDTLSDAIEKIGADVMVLDNLVSLFPCADENSTGEWALANRWLIRLRAAGLGVVLVHHSGKNGSQRGTSHRADNIDTELKLSQKVGGIHTIEFVKSRCFGGADAAPVEYRMTVGGASVTFDLVEAGDSPRGAKKKYSMDDVLAAAASVGKEFVTFSDLTQAIEQVAGVGMSTAKTALIEAVDLGVILKTQKGYKQRTFSMPET